MSFSLCFLGKQFSQWPHFLKGVWKVISFYVSRFLLALRLEWNLLRSLCHRLKVGNTMSILLLNIYKYLGTFCEEKGRLNSVDHFSLGS